MDNNMDFNKYMEEYLETPEKFGELMSMFRREASIKWGKTPNEFISRCEMYKTLGEVLGYSSKSNVCVLNTGEVVWFVGEPHYIIDYAGSTDSRKIEIITEILNGLCGSKAKEAFISWHDKYCVEFGRIVYLLNDKYSLSKAYVGELKKFYAIMHEDYPDYSMYHLGVAEILEEKYGEPTIYRVRLSKEGINTTMETWILSDCL